MIGILERLKHWINQILFSSVIEKSISNLENIPNTLVMINSRLDVLEARLNGIDMTLKIISNKDAEDGTKQGYTN